MEESAHGMDPSLAWTALFEAGQFDGLTFDEQDRLKAGLLSAWYAQEEIRNMWDFAKAWVALPQAERDADVAWAAYMKTAGKPLRARPAFIAGYLARGERDAVSDA